MQNGGPVLIFRIPLAILLLPIIIAVLGASVALFAQRTNRPVMRRNSLIIALIAGIGFAPSMYLNTVTVFPTHIEQDTGLLFLRIKKGFSYSEVSFVHIKEVLDGRNEPKTIWELHMRDGSVVDLHPGDLWQWNSDQIVPYLESRGVEVR